MESASRMRLSLEVAGGPAAAEASNAMRAAAGDHSKQHAAYNCSSYNRSTLFSNEARFSAPRPRPIPPAHGPRRRYPIASALTRAR